MALPWRNAVTLPDGRIDCEIQHPVYGWVPFTADAADPVALGREVHAALAAVPNKPVRAAPSAADILAAKRAGTSLTMSDFIERCRDTGYLTAAEADGLARKTGLPAWATAALDQAFGAGTLAREKAALRIWSAATVARASPIVAAMQAAKSLTAAQVDTLFGIA